MKMLNARNHDAACLQESLTQQGTSFIYCVRDFVKIHICNISLITSVDRFNNILHNNNSYQAAFDEPMLING